MMTRCECAPQGKVYQFGSCIGVGTRTSLATRAHTASTLDHISLCLKFRVLQSFSTEAEINWNRNRDDPLHASNIISLSVLSIC